MFILKLDYLTRRKAKDARNNRNNPSDIRKGNKLDEQLAIENENRLEAGLTIIDSFEPIAREWGEKKVNNWIDKNNRSKRMLERDVFP